MSVIRPFLPQSLPSQGMEPSRARSAQSAFFQAALGQTSSGQAAAQPAAQPPAQPLPSAAVASVMRTATPTRPAELPAAPEREEPRIMRPGSLLDIRI